VHPCAGGPIPWGYAGDVRPLVLHDDRITDADGHAWAGVWGGNLLRGPARASELVEAPRWVVWSGTPAVGLFDEHPLAWAAPAWDALGRALEELATLAGAARRVLVRPHARHVVSDIPSCLRLVERLAVPVVGVILDPASMLTPGMLPARQDHVLRILEALGAHPRVDAVIARDRDVRVACARVCPAAVTVE
jgi:hypothetical protein